MDAATLARAQAAWPQLQPLQHKFLAALYAWQVSGGMPAVSNKHMTGLFSKEEAKQLNSARMPNGARMMDYLYGTMKLVTMEGNRKWRLAPAAVNAMGPAQVAALPAAAPARPVAVPRRRMDTSADDVAAPAPPAAAPLPPAAAPPPVAVVPRQFDPVDTSMPFVLPLSFPIREHLLSYDEGGPDVTAIPIGLVEGTCTVQRARNDRLVFKGRVNGADVQKYVDEADEEILVDHAWIQPVSGSANMRVTDLGRRLAEVWHQQRERGLLFDTPDSWALRQIRYEWPMLTTGEFLSLKDTRYAETYDDAAMDMLDRNIRRVAVGDIVYAERMHEEECDVYKDLDTAVLQSGAQWKINPTTEMLYVRINSTNPQTWPETLRQATNSLAENDGNGHITYDRCVEMAAVVRLEGLDAVFRAEDAQYLVNTGGEPDTDKKSGIPGIADWQESATEYDENTRTSDVTRLTFLQFSTTAMPVHSLSFSALVYLRDLTLLECDRLVEITALPPNLRALSITRCQALQSLSPSHSLAHMSSLLYVTLCETGDCITPQQQNGTATGGLYAWPPRMRKLSLTRIACTEIAGLPKTVVSLSLVLCPSLKVPQGIGYLPNLRQLVLREVASPVVLTNAPFRSLRYLDIHALERIEPSPPETFSLLYRRTQQQQDPRNGIPCVFVPFRHDPQTGTANALGQWFERHNPLVWRMAMQKAVAAKKLPEKSTTHVVMQHIYQFMKRASVM
jgi:hypothetical protein